MNHARTIPPSFERAGALILLIGVIFLSGWIVTSPLRAALALHVDARDRFDEYQAIVQEPLATSAGYDPALLVAAYADESNAQLDLQSVLDMHARDASLAVRSLTPAGSESLGGLGQITWIEASLTGDLQAMLDFLAALDHEQPVLLIRAAEIDVGNPADPNRALEVRVEVGRGWRPVETGA